MHTSRYKLIEFFIIFIVVPVSFAVDYPFVIKAVISVLGFLYVTYILLKVQGNKFQLIPNIQWKSFWVSVSIKFIIIAITTSVFVWFTNKDDLFHLVYQKPGLWVLLIFAYTIFSVYPQELLYRTLYFQRYETLFKSKSLFICLNAIVFSLAHLFFKNPLVMLMTFLGGILFALTYDKTKSTVLVSIEHAIYGSWLFTVGMGGMLGFPS